MAEQTWTINFIPEEGGRITGKLTVGDEDVVFRALYDSSFKSIVKNIGFAVGSLAATGGHLVYLREEGNDGVIVIPRTSIQSAEAGRKGLMKRVIISLTDGQQFTFEYGLLSVKKLVGAING
ncbi:MAG: hypothetical protein ACYTG6_05415 [Planctomycetota bacterium]|jgi:hypothetical protein